MARLIKDGDTVFHESFLAHAYDSGDVTFAKALHAPDAVHLNIPGGVDPYPAELQKYTSAGTALTDTSVADFPLSDVFDLSMREAGSM